MALKPLRLSCQNGLLPRKSLPSVGVGDSEAISGQERREKGLVVKFVYFMDPLLSINQMYGEINEAFDLGLLSSH
ncbi:hypothetical protein PGT21_021005 [Puccinia graminis f. sp. tritici]|uniref:Uncharacterized protein n=1 Tax=Puccinia graminis f. sp. tritici TaxID=56615 RepID=A0A5B0M260_PUCGR|nr:hypothetical protein PGT21_021005 [Puccinia graminis f. sp. tritici]